MTVKGGLIIDTRTWCHAILGMSSAKISLSGLSRRRWDVWSSRESLIDPSEEVIVEETELDNQDVPGPPITKEAERRAKC